MSTAPPPPGGRVQGRERGLSWEGAVVEALNWKAGMKSL